MATTATVPSAHDHLPSLHTDTRPTSTEKGTTLTPINTASSAAAARRYYDTADVDGFYTAVWGGEFIHMGIYTGEHDEIATASHRTTERMADKVITHLGPGRTVLDLGSGYGGPRPLPHVSIRLPCRGTQHQPRAEPTAP